LYISLFKHLKREGKEHHQSFPLLEEDTKLLVLNSIFSLSSKEKTTTKNDDD
tara:strand:- start:146 stop:301 length:156 start_codon:yes stop_codon:yes gene_type:complete